MNAVDDVDGMLLAADDDVVAMQDKMVPEQVDKMMMKEAADGQRTQ